MNVKSPLLLVLCVAAASLISCRHTQSPWDGQWNLNEARSHAALPTFTVAISPGGKYHVNDEFIDYSFRCDGTPYPTNGSGGFITCIQNDPKIIVLKKNTNGSDSTSTRWELSADDKTLTTIDRLIQIDGSTKDKQLVYTRDSGASGFSGRWKASGPFDSRTKTVVLILNYNAFHFEDRDWGQFSDSRLQEPPTTIRGANQPFGFSRSAKLISPREIQTEDFFADRVIQQTTWKVSNDGKTLYEESSAPKNASGKDLLVYDKY